MSDRASGMSDPGSAVQIRFDGTAISTRTGVTVGAALTDAGIRSWRTTRFGGAPRGLFCGIGVCYDCLITIDGAPNQRACVVPVADGMQVTTGAADAVASIDDAGIDDAGIHAVRIDAAGIDAAGIHGVGADD